MKRFTADDVVIELQRSRDNCGCSEYYQGVALGFLEALKIVRDNLIPQWQDEPDEDGWYWVEGEEDPIEIWMNQDGTWTCDGFTKHVGRVCPIGERPKP